MKTLLTLIALAAPVWAQQSFDFKSLDKLDALATSKTKVTLDADMLKLAVSFLGGSDDSDGSLKSLAGNLKGVYVRTYEFDKDGQYSVADIEPLRNYLKQRQWTKIVESQEGKDMSEIYILPAPNNRFGGVAIIDTEPRELTVVYINGSLNLSDLEKLQGNMGVPNIDLKGAKKPAPAQDKKKDDERGNREEQDNQ
jgi:hypothetical protein